MARKRRSASVMRRLHRSLGAFAAVFVFFMVVSGLAINHSNGLGLNQRHASQGFLLDWYGLDGPEHIRSFAVNGSWLSFAGSQLYLDGKFITNISDGVGALSSGDLVVAAGSDELLLLDPEGNLVERIAWGPIGTIPIESIGQGSNNTVMAKSAGQVWLADAELVSWRQSDEQASSANWAAPEPAPVNIEKDITHQYRGDGLSLERLLLDLHSGRIFGTFGVLVYDLLAIAIGFLSISGLVLWFRGRRNGKPKNGS